MVEFVLVPGAWLGAWAWEDVVPAPRAAGHGAQPVTLSGERAGGWSRWTPVTGRCSRGLTNWRGSSSMPPHPAARTRRRGEAMAF